MMPSTMCRLKNVRPPKQKQDRYYQKNKYDNVHCAPFYTSTDLFGIAANGVLGHENTLRPPFEKIGGGVLLR